ncbi:MAG: methyltransferase domain-containing protein [Thaumarchaeota archaeon]|nr:methyltransferase domain-containing protein [Nitrososphaerota archaeon]
MNLPDSKTMNHWNRNASGYDELSKRNNVVIKSADKIVEILKIRSGESCLDVCCGTGILTKKLGRQVGDGGFVLGVDMAKDMLEIAKNRIFVNTELVNCVAERFEFRKKFDVITCQFGLQLLDSYEVFAKIKQVMKKPTSRIGIVVHGQHAKHIAIFNSIARKLLNDGKFGFPTDEFMRFDAPFKLKQRMVENGLEVVSIEECYFSRHYSSFDEYVDRQMSRMKNYKKFDEPLLRSQLESKLREKIQEFKIGDGFEFPHQVIFCVAKISESKFGIHSNHLPEKHQTKVTKFI